MKYCFPSPIGNICLKGDGKNITSLELNVETCAYSDSREVFCVAKKQILEYFAGKRREFDIPIHPVGTEFQLSVWEQVKNIPYGQVITYGDIAKAINRPNASRAVGNAVGANPLPIIIPCHRVVAANGIGGFSCGLELKRKLMSIEGIML
ncbi:MAG: methylated-DNA--[protein]-cysteine S-methyltransferase [Ruminococcaceae bacterium]|nr:methylated-DNA--[protein]-cysteine S-methyltransferase [Oscillospiraceae bacterium]